MKDNSLPQIYADSHGLKHAELTGKLIGIFYSVYNELGHGFLESVYEQAMSIALAENGLFFQRQIAIPVWFHQQQVGEFRADLLVNEQIILELKTGRDIDMAWEKQVLNYLRATQIEVALLLNFGPQAQFKRYVFENGRKIPRKSAKSAEKKLINSNQF